MAKPSGAYTIGSRAWQDNAAQINSFFNQEGYTIDAQAGMMGNMQAESGMNPWRWQGDRYNLSGGYGLYQFTPARSYIPGCKDVAGYAPNLSTSQITSGAQPSDGYAQLTVFNEDRLGKWVSTCWRPYWDREEYWELWGVRTHVLDTWGNGERISLSQFKTIDDPYHAAFCFLACYEGPAVPNMDTRWQFTQEIYTYLTGDTPPPEPPIPGRGSRSKIWMWLRKF